MPSACACEDCVQMCVETPCWGTPAEAQALIQAGYGGRLMLDRWVGGIVTDVDQIDILGPAIVGREGKPAPSRRWGRCTFLTKEGRCELHGSGLKPIEGRLAHHDGTPDEVHEAVAATWENPEAVALVAAWIEVTQSKREVRES